MTITARTIRNIRWAEHGQRYDNLTQSLRDMEGFARLAGNSGLVDSIQSVRLINRRCGKLIDFLDCVEDVIEGKKTVKELEDDLERLSSNF